MCSDAVSSTGFHPYGNVLATCSGQRHFSAPARDTLDNSEDGMDGSKSENDDGVEHSSMQSIPSHHSHSSDASSSSPESSAFSPVSREFDNSLRIWAW